MEIIKRSKLFPIVCVLRPKQFSDARGVFSEVFNETETNEAIAKDLAWKQDNRSISYAKGTIRGMHFQKPPSGQAKLVSCSQGAIADVVVDIRTNSPTFAQWEIFEISSENRYQLFVPEGFAHGFVTLEDNSHVFYKCSELYAPDAEGSLRWNDPVIGIDWPLSGEPILSEKDARAPFIDELDSPFTFEESKIT